MSDGLLTDTGTVTVTIGSVNDAPFAADDTASTDEDTAVTINVLANDSDPELDTLSVTEVSTPGHGTAVLNGDNTVTYTPVLDYVGSDSFTYTVSDGLLTDTGTVTVTIGSVNDGPVAVDDSASTDEDTAVTVDVLVNDSDPESDSLSVTSVGIPSHGIAVLNGDNTITYTPVLDYVGSDSFTYTVSDGNGGSATAAVSVSIGSVNDPPVASDDSATTEQNTAMIIAVLSNDYDVDGDELNIIIVSAPEHGTAGINNPDGTVTYIPSSDYIGTDSFIYTITDGNGGTATATVTVTVKAISEGPAQECQELIDYIAIQDCHKGLQNSLIAKLSKAIESIEEEDYKETINILNAAINEVDAKAGKTKISEEEAEYLISEIKAIIALIGE